MTAEQLTKRIEAKKAEIEKINKRIAKWSKGLRKEDIAVCEPFANCVYGTCPRSMTWSNYHGTPEYQEASKNYKAYIDSHNDIPESDDWNKGPNIGELKAAYRDLGEAKNTLSKYEAELQNLNKFESDEKIEIIWKFLMDWKQMLMDYYHKQAAELTLLRAGYSKALEDYMNLQEVKDEIEELKTRYHYSDWRANYYIKNKFEKEYYEDIDSLTFELTDYRGNVNEKLLNDKLNKEVKRKYEKLVADVTEKAGEILDASNLHINPRGEISGTIKGSKNVVNLWMTFVVGDIQRPHYRGYCHIAK